ncbi:DMT family transporter [Paracoccaceae bacterium]|nr:DMT family transporter [Paracoccaceae bacterium]
MENSIHTKHWIMIGTLGVVWGSTFLFIELALQGITPLWLTSARIIFAAVITSIIWLIRGGILFTTHETAWLRLGVIGIISTALPFQLISWGQQYVTSSFAGLAMASMPLFVLPLAYFFNTNEAIDRRKFIGFIIGFLGIAILFSPDFTPGADTSIFITLGKLACILAAFCYASNSILMRKLPKIDPVGLAATSLLIGSVWVILWALAIEGPPPKISRNTFLILILLGLLPTAMANFIRVVLIREAGPVFLGITNYIVPLWAAMVGALVLRETLPIEFYLSATITIVGIYISQMKALSALIRSFKQ